mmetsp:Transcript_22095/g.84046  ORF Transcript_22095/g.84046 Transcript_22095/m.84046 type:complete len:230 (+) Transcript_22095:2809-3498(+)
MARSGPVGRGAGADSDTALSGAGLGRSRRQLVDECSCDSRRPAVLSSGSGRRVHSGLHLATWNRSRKAGRGGSRWRRSGGVEQRHMAWAHFCRCHSWSFICRARDRFSVAALCARTPDWPVQCHHFPVWLVLCAIEPAGFADRRLRLRERGSAERLFGGVRSPCPSLVACPRPRRFDQLERARGVGQPEAADAEATSTDCGCNWRAIGVVGAVEFMATRQSTHCIARWG